DRGRPRAVRVNPFAFYLGVVRKLKRVRPPRPPKPSGGEWSKDAVIYNMFIRTAAAFDHNGNGKLDLPANRDGFRETGTFLKAMAMLPYIKRLGATAIHLLPITAIGHDGNKGSLGSPYAIRDPYELDENLAEPALGLDVKTEFQAFVEAAHAMGFHIVLEFVFRTAAKDAAWVKEHPEWFYWIREEIPPRKPGDANEAAYGSPLFTAEELHRIHDAVNNGRFGELPQPHQQFRDFFTPPPALVQKEDGRMVGSLADRRRVRVPGAFADWPPDDNQPPWTDVTYLRMYTHPDFNYIGYNTIRMYDSRLARPEYVNRPLWERIIGIIPYYQKEFGIDGVMIDMGHALPKDLKSEMVRTARAVNPDFAFWDENFAIAHKSREEGYNAVFGYLWHIEHIRQYVREFCWRLHHETLPLPFFATAESHNTHRAAAREGGTCYAHWTLVVNMFMPAIPFIHAGYELAEEYPINTGLDFTGEELRKMPSETLPLFSEFAYDWTRRTEFTALVSKVLRIRRKYHALVTNPHHETFRMLGTGSDAVLAYARLGGGQTKRLAVVANLNCTNSVETAVPLESPRRTVTDLVTGKRIRLTAGTLQTELGPGESLVFEY
ncbi:MAG TPA: alpha-amylase family glycosyl hydrolase, partial [Bacteroidota bacterium]